MMKSVLDQFFADAFDRWIVFSERLQRLHRPAHDAQNVFADHVTTFGRGIARRNECLDISARNRTLGIEQALNGIQTLAHYRYFTNQ